MLKRLSRILLLAVLLGAHGAPYTGSWLSGAEAHAASITLPRTGQTGCWDAAGNSRACANTGEDGAKLKGAAWPSPALPTAVTAP